MSFVNSVFKTKCLRELLVGLILATCLVNTGQLMKINIDKQLCPLWPNKRLKFAEDRNLYTRKVRTLKWLFQTDTLHTTFPMEKNIFGQKYFRKAVICINPRPSMSKSDQHTSENNKIPPNKRKLLFGNVFQLLLFLQSARALRHDKALYKRKPYNSTWRLPGK